MDNRFEQLRYKDKHSLNPEISMSQLAQKMGISKATISKLEHDDNYDARISIIKKYKEQFPDVSYDYLLGATNTKHKQYNRVEEELPFDNEFYEKLQILIDAKKHSSDPRLTAMLEALLYNPEALVSLLLEIYSCLDEIYSISNGPDEYEYLWTETKKYAINRNYYKITSSLTEFLDKNITPLLAYQFEKNLQKHTDLINTLLGYGDESVSPVERLERKIAADKEYSRTHRVDGPF